MEKTQVNTKPEGGNTITPSGARCRKWTFTLNNYNVYDKPMIIDYCNTKHIRFIFGEEVGNSGTPHLQGFMEFKNPIQFKTLQKFLPRAHWEMARGDIVQNFNYCSKDNNYYTNIYIEKPNIIVKPTNWQLQLLDIVKSIPNDRDIIWIYDTKGNIGKTAIAKFMLWNKLAFLCKSGSAKDIKALLLATKESRDIVIDLTRSNENFVSYTLMEELKDGFIFSTKYEGGCKLISTPHVIVFANFSPDISKLSIDRWKIFTIVDDSLHKIPVEELENYI